MMSLMRNNSNKNIYPLKRIFTHNLVGIYNKCTTDVLGVRCNGKAQESFYFFPLQVHDLTDSYFPLHLHLHICTHTHTCTASPLCRAYLRVEPRHCWKMLLPEHLCVCTWVHKCLSFCVFMILPRCMCAREITFSCYSSNGPAETCVSLSKVPGYCLIWTPHRSVSSATDSHWGWVTCLKEWFLLTTKISLTELVGEVNAVPYYTEFQKLNCYTVVKGSSGYQKYASPVGPLFAFEINIVVLSIAVAIK